MKTSKKIMMTGAHGFVGTRAVEYYKDAIIVGSEFTRELGEALKSFVREHQPDIIINSAAISDIATCEKYPEASYKANVILPVVLAEVAGEIGAKLISFSSDQVYTGCREPGPYREDTVLPPAANLYGRQKQEAEQRVLEILPSAVMLRATWMFDMPVYGHDNRGNYLMNVLDAAIHGRPIAASSGEFRGLTYVRPVVSLLDKIAEVPGGIYNYGSENTVSLLETTEAFLKIFGIKAEVKDVAANEHNLWMDCSKLRALDVSFDSTIEGFERCGKITDLFDNEVDHGLYKEIKASLQARSRLGQRPQRPCVF